MKHLLRAAMLSVWAADADAQTSSDPVPAANPGRPTVSTPATLTPVGYLQFENGMLGATQSPEFSTRVAINQVTKLTVAPRLQLLLISEPFIHSRGEDAAEIHAGEVFAGIQGVLVPGEGARPTISLSYIRRLYVSPAPELDLGTFHQGAIVLMSSDLWGFHFDGNAIFNEQIEGSTRRAQYAQTLSISHPVKKFTISGELWHFSQPFSAGNAVGNLWGVSYPVRPNVVVDVGFNHGFTSTSTQWTAFAGVTYLLPHRLW